jgi:hypothetical protein
MSLFALLTVAGDHFPVIPFDEVVGNSGAAVPEQNELLIVNVGVIEGLTVIEIGTGFKAAHCPASGVKLYISLFVLITIAGDHVPVIPFDEVVGNSGAVVPEQNELLIVNVGVIEGVTVIEIGTGVKDAHCPASGVKL